MEKTEAKTEQANNKLPGILPAVIVSLVVGVIFGWLIFSAVAKPATAIPTGAQLAGLAVLPKDSVGSKTVAYLNENFLKTQGVEAKLAEISPYGNALYLVSVDIFKDGNKLQSANVFVTQDGNLVMLQAPLNLNEKIPEQPAQTDTTAQTSSYKDIMPATSAQLEAFIVSRCPYGFQMQRILAPVATGFAQNIKVRYIGSVENGKIISMHGDEEAQENLRQICIREEQSGKYWPYVSEYMKKGDTQAALAAAGIDQAKLASCMADASKGIAYAQLDFDLANENGVSGSPTLFLNGILVSEFEFGADNGAQGSERSAENVKNLLCYGFTTKPKACSSVLAKENASAGLSEQYSGGSASGGSCS